MYPFLESLHYLLIGGGVWFSWARTTRDEASEMVKPWMMRRGMMGIGANQSWAVSFRRTQSEEIDLSLSDGVQLAPK
jgi:hypothetical protein